MNEDVEYLFTLRKDEIISDFCIHNGILSVWWYGNVTFYRMQKIESMLKMFYYKMKDCDFYSATFSKD